MVYALFLGLLIGFLFKTLAPPTHTGGWIVTLLLGLTGAVITHFVSAKEVTLLQTEFLILLLDAAGTITIIYLYSVLFRKTAQLNG